METLNTFAIYQREKSQAINLLDRIADRLIEYQIEVQNSGDYDYDVQDAQNTVTRLINDVEAKRTQLDAQTVTLTEVANLLRNIQDAQRGAFACEYAATHFSNFNIDRDEFLLACRYSLPTRDELLRSCRHGVDISTDVCLPCDCGEVR